MTMARPAHSLVLLRSPEHRLTPWTVSCACGLLTGRYSRSRRDAVRRYRRHLVVTRPTSARGYRPLRPTPTAALPLDLQPRVVSFS